MNVFSIFCLLTSFCCNNGKRVATKAFTLGIKPITAKIYMQFVIQKALISEIRNNQVSSEMIVQQMTQSSYNMVFDHFCGLFGKLLIESGCVEKEKKNKLDYVYTIKTSEPWSVIKCKFESDCMRTQLQSTTNDHNVASALKMFVETCVKNIDTYLLTKLYRHLTGMKTETSCLKIKIEDASGNSKALSMRIDSCFKKCDDRNDEMQSTVFTDMHKLAHSLVLGLKDCDRIVINSNQEESFLNIITEAVHNISKTRSEINISSIEQLICSKALEFLKSIIIHDQTKDNYICSVEQKLALDGRTIDYRCLVYNFERSILHYYIKRCTISDIDAHKINQIIAGVFRLIKFISFVAIYDMLAIEKTQYTSFITSLHKMNTESFVALIRDLNNVSIDSIDFMTLKSEVLSKMPMVSDKAKTDNSGAKFEKLLSVDTRHPVLMIISHHRIQNF